MPINSLRRLDASFPRLGKIKKGGEKPKSGPGKDLDYFRFDTTALIQQKIQAIYGSEPRELRVWLPHSEIEQNFDPWMKEYSAGSLKRQCDGDQQHVWMEGNQIKSVSGGCQPLACVRETTGCECRRVAHLPVMIAELFAEGVIGYFALETHAINDILGITANLQAAYALRSNLCGIPFVLRRQMRNISTPRGDSRVRRDVSLISIEPDPAWVQAQFRRSYEESMRLYPSAEAAEFHSAGPSQGGGYLLPEHHQGSAAIEVTSAAPSVLIKAEAAAAAESAKSRIAGLLSICGLSNEVAKAIRLGLHGDRSISTYTTADLDSLRDQFFVDWAKPLECWSDQATPAAAWLQFEESLPPWIEDSEVFDLWVQFCLDLCDRGAAVEVEVMA
jgi:hypothetical protein